MVYLAVVAGKEQLFTANVDGSNPAQITHDAIDHEDPAWSLDGKRIAYVALSGDTSRIWVMDVDGTHAAPVSPTDRKVIHPRWNPDGRHLAWCTTDDLDPPRKNDSEIQQIDLATGRIDVLLTGGVNTYPAFSPDGKRIAYRHFVGENSEVFIANADGSQPRNITNNPAFDGWPAWSPDGKRIAFSSNRNSSYQIYVMNPDGSGVRLVANTEGRATYPQWRPDGKAIYFSLCRNVDFGTGCEIMVAPMAAADVAGRNG
jgi:TolB protein